ncbi:sterol desaturase family protein [Sphingobium herbicidovorans]|uniref:sterol desaturase family protein n=1 Tax=Sphingobium herbicidovorans TaxID=76947 RepID=UPI0018CD6359|nr:sterol desaturase family protein [Sphingobium herbicidovorans]
MAAGLIGIPLAYITGAAAIWASQATGLQLNLIHPDRIGLGLPVVDEALRILAMILVPLAVYDFWLAFSHRLEHHVPALWDIHQVHHSDRWMNPLTVFRDNFLQIQWRSFFSMLTIGLFVDLNFKEGGQAAVYSQLFLFAWAALCHSNIRVELPWLEGILVTPQYHRIHHSTQAEHIDKNFADVFPLFDMLFGSYVRPRKGEFPETGLASGEAIDGIGGVIFAPFRSWLKRLRLRFR